MATGAKRIYLDPNILAYVAKTKAPQHKAALEIFRPTERENLCVSSQVLAEFYSCISKNCSDAAMSAAIWGEMRSQSSVGFSLLLIR